MSRLGLLVGTILTGLMLLSPEAVANAAPAAQSSASSVYGCSTWQYETDSGAPIYPSGTTAHGLVNVNSISGGWHWGNFYYWNGGSWVRYNTGWIWVSHIHYLRCW